MERKYDRYSLFYLCSSVFICGCFFLRVECSRNIQREGYMANRKAIIETNKGKITVELYEDKAPITAGNFIDLVERGFYDGLTFHRYEPNFVIQGGDPLRSEEQTP